MVTVGGFPRRQVPPLLLHPAGHFCWAWGRKAGCAPGMKPLGLVSAAFLLVQSAPWESLLLLADEIMKVPATPDVNRTDTEHSAALEQRSGFSGGRHVASDGRTDVSGGGSEAGGVVETKRAVFSRNVTKRHGLSPSGNWPLKKRVKGVEPSTFTLAT